MVLYALVSGASVGALIHRRRSFRVS